MNKLALLLLLALPACAFHEENARLTQAALTQDQAVCADRGDQPGSDSYLRCMRKLGNEEGYRVTKADDGQVVFALHADHGIPNSPVLNNGIPPTAVRMSPATN